VEAVLRSTAARPYVCSSRVIFGKRGAPDTARVTQSRKHEPRAGMSVGEVLTAVRASHRIGVLDVLLRSARTHPAVRVELEAERQRRLQELRSAGITEVVFEDVA
jgi:hypothetical protein